MRNMDSADVILCIPSNQAVTQLILLGDPLSKRTLYFQRAFLTLLQTQQIPASISLDCLDYAAIEDIQRFDSAIIKLDPPALNLSDISALNNHMAQHYQMLSSRLARPEFARCRYLNPLSEIQFTLNKRTLKQRLRQYNIACTPQIIPADCQSQPDGYFEDFDALVATLKQQKIHKVFIKHNLGAGAAGILALNLHPSAPKMMAYTTCHLHDHQLINTKKIWQHQDHAHIKRIVNVLLQQGAIVEKWLAKAQHHGNSYDLRVVYQFGQIVHKVVRFSKGPITNLHLNNQAADISVLALSPTILDKIDALCHAAMACLPDLRVAGIDVLLSAHTLTPYIIEINAQGDCIYNDMLNGNLIYQQQINHMCTNANVLNSSLKLQHPMELL